MPNINEIISNFFLEEKTETGKEEDFKRELPDGLKVLGLSGLFSEIAEALEKRGSYFEEEGNREAFRNKKEALKFDYLSFLFYGLSGKAKSGFEDTIEEFRIKYFGKLERDISEEDSSDYFFDLFSIEDVNPLIALEIIIEYLSGREEITSAPYLKSLIELFSKVLSGVKIPGKESFKKDIIAFEKVLEESEKA